MRKEGNRPDYRTRAPKSLLAVLATLQPLSEIFRPSLTCLPIGRALMRYLLDTNIVSDLIRIHREEWPAYPPVG